MNKIYYRQIHIYDVSYLSISNASKYIDKKDVSL